MNCMISIIKCVIMGGVLALIISMVNHIVALVVVDHMHYTIIINALNLV